MAQVTNEKRGRAVDGETPTSAAEQMTQLGHLLAQGYEKGARGRGCWDCSAEFCGGCGLHRVVEVG